MSALVGMGCGLLGDPGAAAKAGAAHARAVWLSESATGEGGQTLQTAIRLEVDAGWHAYWLNPGEGAMPTMIEWHLPPGWKAGSLGHPLPQRYLTSGLHGFGHEGTVLLPVALTPPAGFTGRAKLEGTLSWLTCCDEACEPGTAKLTLEVAAGSPVPGSDAPAIRKALAAVPEACDTLVLEVEEKAGLLKLTMRRKDGVALGEPPTEAFPSTPNVVEPAAPVRFALDGGVWRAEAARSGFASGPVTTLDLVFARPGARPAEVVWHKPG